MIVTGPPAEVVLVSVEITIVFGGLEEFQVPMLWLGPPVNVTVTPEGSLALKDSVALLLKWALP